MSGSSSSSSFTPQRDGEEELDKSDARWENACSEGFISTEQKKRRREVRSRLANAKHDRDKLGHSAKRPKPGVLENLKERFERHLRLKTSCAPGALELFCGSAGITSDLRKCGFVAIGVDWKGN